MHKTRRNSPFMAFCVLFIVLSFSGGLMASQDVAFKGPRPPGGDPASAQAGGDAARVGKEALERSKAYVYDPTGKTDPFKSFVLEQEVYEEEKAVRPKTYLESLDLSQLELIAIILNPKGNWAMVRDAKGLGHVIRKGTAIGTHGGVVHQINEGEVVVRERYKDFRGQVIVKDIPKRLPSLE